MIKRTFDCSMSVVALVSLSPLFLIVAALIKLDSEGPVFFRQERVGKGFRDFRIYKFRTMVEDGPHMGRPITCGEDRRITRIGRFLRNTKIDELPQLINVLKGEMSIVGPRPEMRQYVERFRHDYAQILKVRPGITDIASLRYRHEAAELGASDDPETMYLTRILPEKLDLGKEYVRRSSLFFDVALIFKTIAALSRRNVS